MKNSVEIIAYQAKYKTDFERLNLEWLEAYFEVEDYDREVLGKPQQYILDKGGYIFFAKVGEEVVGTVALIAREEGVFELSKMAVQPNHQGLRIGQKLMYRCIDFAGQIGCERLFLDSNTILVPAIRLYEKVGFKEIPVPADSPYERSNIRMELKI